jgi:hypothetical protein
MSKRAVLLLVSTLIVAACGGSGAGEASTTTEIPTTTTTTIPTTTTTLGPQEVVDRFLELVTDPGFGGAAELELELIYLGTSFPGTGSLVFHGDDYHGVYDYEDLGVSETIQLAGVTYESDEGGPWVSDEAKVDPFAEPPAGGTIDTEQPQLIAFLQTIAELTHLGTEVREGVEVHRIGVPEGTVLDPVAFGFDAGDGTTVEATFYANPDGTPHTFTYRTVTPYDGEPLETLTTVRLTDGSVPAITPPEDPWLVYESADLGYRIAYPKSWDAVEYRDEEIPNDWFFGLVGGEAFSIYRTDLDRPEEISLNQWMSGASQQISDEGFSTGEVTELTVGGFPARRLDYTGGEDGSAAYAAYLVVQVDPTIVLELGIIIDEADRARAEEDFSDFLSTFEWVG